jgi:hypothetical protein
MRIRPKIRNLQGRRFQEATNASEEKGRKEDRQEKEVTVAFGF